MPALRGGGSSCTAPREKSLPTSALCCVRALEIFLYCHCAFGVFLFPFFLFFFLSEKLCRLCSYDVGVLQVFISLRSYCYQKAEQCLLDKAGGEKLRGFTEEVFNRAKNEIRAPKQRSPNYWARFMC